MGSKDLESISVFVEQAKSGDKKAIDFLINLTQKKLFKFIYYLTGDKNTASDIFQETYIRAIENIGNIKNDKAFMGWLYRTAKNVFIDYTRNKFNRSESIENVPEMVAENKHDNDLCMQINSILESLEHDERLIILLVDLEGYSYKEAAELIEITEDSLRMKVFRARKKFISLFNEMNNPLKSSYKQENEDEQKE